MLRAFDNNIDDNLVSIAVCKPRDFKAFAKTVVSHSVSIANPVQVWTDAQEYM